MTRRALWVLAVVLALVAVSFGIKDHTWVEPTILIVFIATVLYITTGSTGS